MGALNSQNGSQHRVCTLLGDIRYEVAECIRRLSLTAFLSVYQTGKTQQTVAAILLSVIAIIVFDHCKCELQLFSLFLTSELISID
jgi:hypothetical protein